ncbi:hypothetical protein ABK040_009596 [Willaertia magna]
MSTGIPREIIKWMQSLDLSYSIKNVRRDFANGFLIAEVISRYYPQEIEMHSYDVGVGVKTKLDNWQLLEKFFKKHGLNVSRKLIDDLVSCRPNAVSQILEEIYAFLTDRQVKKVKAVRPPVVNLPNFARPTASQLSKDEGRSVPPNFTVTKPKSSRINSQKLISTSNTNNVEETSAPIPNDNVLFINNGMPVKTGLTVTPFSVNQVGALIDELNLLVEPALEGLNIEGNRKDSFNIFIENYQFINPQQTESLCKTIEEKIANYGDYLIKQPKEFWKLMKILIPGLKYDKESFKEIASIIEKIGQVMLLRDPDSTWELFEDFVLDKIIEIVKSHNSKREELLALVYNFCANEITSHKQALLKVQSKCSHIPLIIHCFSIMIRNESQLLRITDNSNGPIFDEDQSSLFKIYADQAILGLWNNSPKVRASSLSILHTLVAFEDEINENDNIKTNNEGKYNEVSSLNQPILFVMEKIWPKIMQMINDNWWEIQAVIIVLCSKILSQIRKLYMVELQQTYQKRVLETLLYILNKELNSNTKHVALSYLATHTKYYNEDITNIYLELLLSLNDNERVALLEQQSNEIHILQVGNSQQKFAIRSIPFVWDCLNVATKLTFKIVDLDHLEIEHYDILNVCVSVVLLQQEYDNDFESSESEWLNIYEKLQSHFYVGLCDEELCEMASQLLLKFYSVLKREVIKSMIPQIVKTIEILFSNNSLTQQQSVLSKFLIDLYSLGNPFNQPILKLANSLIDQTHLSSNVHLARFINFVKDNMM